MPPLDTIQTIVGGGSALLLGIGVWWLATGRGRVGSLVDKDKQELQEERDDWKALAQSQAPEIKRLNDLLDQAIKLLLNHRP